MMSITEEWVRKAQGDLNSAKACRDVQEYDSACYYYQQSSEKILKALIVERLGPDRYPRTHDLEMLYSRLAETGLHFPENFYVSCRELTYFATAQRYPTAGVWCTFEDCVNAEGYNKVIWDVILPILHGGNTQSMNLFNPNN